MTTSAKSTSVDLSVIIVSHNTATLIGNAIQAVLDTVNSHSFEIIVVENASTDDSFAFIKKTFPKVTLLRTDSLIGFSAANNLGRKHAHGSHLFFLNPDTIVVHHAIDNLLDHMQKHHLKVASGQLRNPDGSIQPQGGALPNLWNVAAWMLFIDDLGLTHAYQLRKQSYFHHEQDNVGWIGGTAFMIETAAFDAVGGWDSKIFLYGEDVELCIRLHRAGLKIGLFPDVQIKHIKQGSVGSSSRAYIGEFEGLIYIWKKYFPTWELPILRLLLVAGAWLRVVIFGILLGDEHRKATYLDAA
ncbi:MAG TPA: glycosyltransferase family 2 protein, partial [Candidatus Saccharimonadia bacterium]|nr:glycosyltransferase family 2 protein [Candidatus Saccharimonadia bacterium]